MRSAPLKSALLALVTVGGALFATISCSVPNFARYLDDTVIIVDRGYDDVYYEDYYYDDDDWWYDDCCW